MSRARITRRTMLRGALRGAALSLGVPPLEAMFDAHGTAYADGTAPPKRFGLWFWCGGICRSYNHFVEDQARFFPDEIGPNWTPKPYTMPLAAVKEYVTLVSNQDHERHNVTGSTAHWWNHAAVLSNSHDPAIGRGGPTGPSLDQVVATAWKGRTRLPSVEVTVSTAGLYPGTSSFRSANQPMPGERDLGRLYDRLFAGGVKPPAPTATGPALSDSAFQTAVVDAVREDAVELRKVVSKSDALRLDAHLEGLRDIERTLQTMPAVDRGVACKQPERPAGGGGIVQRNRLMADMIVTALACDVTRVFNFELQGFQSHQVFTEAGVTVEHHPMLHADIGNRDVDLPKLVPFVMTQLAYLVGKLKATPEGAGNLLDSMCLYVTAEQTRGSDHRTWSLPQMLIGKAGGKLRAGVHWRDPAPDPRPGSGTPKGNAGTCMLTALRAVDIDIKEYGGGAGKTAEHIKDLLVG